MQVILFHFQGQPRHQFSYSSTQTKQIHVAKTEEELELIKASVRATAKKAENAVKDMKNRLETKSKVEMLKEKLKAKKRNDSETENQSEDPDNENSSVSLPEINRQNNDDCPDDVAIQRPIDGIYS